MDFFRFALCFFDRALVSALACSPISSLILICTPNKKCASGKPFSPRNAGNHPINYALIATVAVLLVSLAGCGQKSANAEATVTVYNCGSGGSQTTPCSTPSTTPTGTGTGTSTACTSTSIEKLVLSAGAGQVEVGATLAIKAAGLDCNNISTDVTSSVTWSTGDQGIATINSSGLLSGAGVGTTTVKAVYGTLPSTEISISVTAATKSWKVSTVDATPQIGQGTAIAVDSLGKIHIAYSGPANGIWHAVYEGGAWITTLIEPMVSVGNTISIASNNNGGIHIAYADLTSGAIKYAFRDKNGNLICNTVPTSNTPSATTRASIALDAVGHIFIAFTGWNAAHTQSSVELLTNESGTWQSTIPASNNNELQYPSLKIDINGSLHVIYRQTGNFILFYMKRTGGVWTYESNLGGWMSTYDGAYANMALDANGKVHVAHYDDNHGYLAYTSNVTGAWKTAYMSYKGTYPSIAIDSQNTALISFYGEASGDLILVRCKGGTWYPVTNNTASLDTIDSGGNVGLYTSIALDANDGINIAYYGNGTLKYATFK